MRPLQHRDPGTVGGILADDSLVAELIADGVHVHLGAMRVLLKAKGRLAPSRSPTPFGLRAARRRVRAPGPEGASPWRRGLPEWTTVRSPGASRPWTATYASCATRRRWSSDLFTMAAAVPAGLLGLTRKESWPPAPTPTSPSTTSGLRCMATFVAGQRVF